MLSKLHSLKELGHSGRRTSSSNMWPVVSVHTVSAARSPGKGTATSGAGSCVGQGSQSLAFVLSCLHACRINGETWDSATIAGK